MSKNRSKNNLSYSTSEVIVPAIILLAFAVLIFGIICNFVLKIINKPERIDYDSLIWEQAYLEAQNERVGIIFDPISTLPNEYTALQERCDQYIKENDSDKDIDAEVEVDAVVEEELYIDNTPPEKVSLNEVQGDELSETGPIYFDNMLMIRYINVNGQMKVVSAIYNEDKTGIEIARQDTLPNKYRVKQRDEPSQAYDNIVNTRQKYESEYLDEVSSIIIEMLQASSSEDVNNADKRAIEYFVIDGKRAIYGNKIKLELNKCTVKCNYIIAGKSDTSKTYKDRIYVQFSVKQGKKVDEPLYMILKLNSNLRIFDVDLL